MHVAIAIASCLVRRGLHPAQLSVLPVNEHGFAFHKGAFRGALCLRLCGWLPSGLPTQ